jgi:hypothetical protein
VCESGDFGFEMDNAGLARTASQGRGVSRHCAEFVGSAVLIGPAPVRSELTRKVVVGDRFQVADNLAITDERRVYAY